MSKLAKINFSVTVNIDIPDEMPEEMAGWLLQAMIERPDTNKHLADYMSTLLSGIAQEWVDKLLALKNQTGQL